MYFVDGHCDTLTLAIGKGEDLLNHTGHLSIEKLASFKTAVQVFAIWLDDEQIKTAYEATIGFIDQAHKIFANNSNCIRLATSYSDIIQNIDAGVCTAILGAEGAEPIGSDLARLREFYNKGLRVLTFTWNRDNELSGCIATPNAGGLTQFGHEALAECERLGILVDVSHISVSGFNDVAQAATKPFFASHSNCKALASHKRNLEDAQIRIIAEAGGVVGVNFCDAFLSDSPGPDMNDVLRHIAHIINIGGVECAAFGGDLDGTASPVSGWYKDVLIYKSLYEHVEQVHGATTADKIFFQNYLRMFKEVF
ncbi:MAG: dipeptidase [Defluviitaleaceae bacterium]|nr:dipeptidase [Defluviitaleaceae bacterium]